MGQNQQQRDFPNARRCLAAATGRLRREEFTWRLLPREALAWVLSTLTQTFRIPFDEKLVTGPMRPPYGVDPKVLVADLLGLRTAWAERPAFALRKLVAPFLILLSPALREPHNGLVAGRESLASLDSAAPNPRLAFVLRVEGDGVALFEQGQTSHTILPFSEFEARYADHLLLVAPKVKSLADPDAQSLAGGKFGFRWFIPELLKHRRIFRDVLLASFAIQLMALATPLFTQVVIDYTPLQRLVSA
jgi:subfamily B ATP-binding cassette protein HlyB/CyaB